MKAFGQRDDRSSNNLNVSLPISLTCKLRPGQHDHIPEIFSLVASLDIARPEAAQQGFLRSRYSKDEFRRFMDQGYVTVASLHGKLVTFLVAIPWASDDLTLEHQLVSAVTWTGQSYSDATDPVYQDAIYIAQIGVDPALTRKGIRKHLYGDLIARHLKSHLISAVIEQPTLNVVSATFHIALGF